MQGTSKPRVWPGVWRNDISACWQNSSRTSRKPWRMDCLLSFVLFALSEEELWEPAASCLESPASCTIGLGRTQGKHGFGRDFVHIPGRWPCARRTVFGGERDLAVAHARLPSLGSVRLSDAPGRSWIGHPHSPPFHDQVEIVRGDRDDTVWVVREVLRFAGGYASIEVQGAIHPEDSQRHHVWPAVWTHRCQPTGMPTRSARSRALGKTLLQALAH